MAMVECPECKGQVSNEALICPHCGIALSGRLFGYEYRSKARLFGLPLVHVVCGPGINPLTGRPRVAKGIIAIGPVAMGFFAVGGLAFGGITIGGVAVGLVAVAGCAMAVLLAIGGAAMGLVAIGGGAMGYYALGAAVRGIHRVGANVQDPEAIEFFKRLIGRG